MRILFVGSLAVLASVDCGTAVLDHGDQGTGGELVTAASVTAGVGSGGSGAVGGGGSEPGGAPPIPPLVEVDVGEVMAGMPAVFDAPSGALGFTAIATPPGPLDVIGFQQIAAPDAVAIISGHGIAGTLWQFQREGVVTAAMPVTDHPEAMPLMAGAWSFTLSNQTSVGPANLSVWYRQTLDGAFHSGLIDVNFFVVPGVANESYLDQLAQSALDGFAGLGLGTVRYAALDSQFAVVDDGNFYELIAETAGALGKPALNVMVVEYIDTANMPLGFSPGAPGNALEHGTTQSGLVMMITGDSGLDRVVLRHETGHYAGLMHTSELTPGYGDVLDDSPFCSDVPTMLGSCPDITNLMFPYADPSNPMLLTNKQSTVVQASALYRGSVEEGGGYAEPLDGSSTTDGGDGHAAASAHDDRSRESARIAKTARNMQGLAQLPPDASQFLLALWCGVDSAVGTHEPWSTLATLGVSAEDLLALARDPGAPDYLRARAALGAAHLGSAAGLSTLARDRTLSRRLRIAALRAVELRAPAKGRVLSRELAADPDARVARAARHKTE